MKHSANVNTILRGHPKWWKALYEAIAADTHADERESVTDQVKAIVRQLDQFGVRARQGKPIGLDTARSVLYKMQKEGLLEFTESRKFTAVEKANDHRSDDRGNERSPRGHRAETAHQAALEPGRPRRAIARDTPVLRAIEHHHAEIATKHEHEHEHQASATKGANGPIQPGNEIVAFVSNLDTSNAEILARLLTEITGKTARVFATPQQLHYLTSK